MMVSEVKNELWPIDERQAIELQNQWRDRIITESGFGEIKTVAGVETAYNIHEKLIFAAVVVMTFPDLKPIGQSFSSGTAQFPYIPGLFAFREGPAIIDAFSRLKTDPDLVIFAAHGIAHPRRFGMASHLGPLLNKPTIGCARKNLVGQYDMPRQDRSETAPLYFANMEVGRVYRTRGNVKPVFISPGHLISLEDSVFYVSACLRGYRLPEPLRAAHQLANYLKRGEDHQVS